MTERVVAAFVPLVDCAVLVAAREQGFAAAEGIDLALVKEPSWANLRDHLRLGHVDCAHALAPLPVALTLGVGGVQADCVVPFVLNRGGNAVTVSTSLFEEMQTLVPFAAGADPARVGAALAAVVGQRRAPLTFGMVFPFSNHNYDLRYWLAAAGIHPDRDVRLVAVPPPLMVDSLRLGVVDGFCVGEPWNSVAVQQGLGSIVVTQAQLVPHSVEKVLALREVFAQRAADALGNLLRALDASAAWVDDPAHHATLAESLARPEYLGLEPEIIAMALSGRLRLGAGRAREDPDFMFFRRHAANVPDTASGVWAYAQMVRWGQVAASAAGQRAAARVMRSDLYQRALPAITPDAAAIVPFDGLPFSVANVTTYLAQFALDTPFAAASSK